MMTKAAAAPLLPRATAITPPSSSSRPPPPPLPPPPLPGTTVLLSSLHWWTTDAEVEAVAREFGPVISARARSGGPGEGREGQDDEGRRLVGWWGLSHPAQISRAAQIGGGHQKVRRGPSGGSARLLQSQILPASGVAMEVKGKQQQQQRERQR